MKHEKPRVIAMSTQGSPYPTREGERSKFRAAWVCAIPLRTVRASRGCVRVREWGRIPEPDREAVLLRFIRGLEAFIVSVCDADSAADPGTVRKAEERLVSLERDLRLLREQRP